MFGKPDDNDQNLCNRCGKKEQMNVYEIKWLTSRCGIYVDNNPIIKNLRRIVVKWEFSEDNLMMLRKFIQLDVARLSASAPLRVAVRTANSSFYYCEISIGVESENRAIFTFVRTIFPFFNNETNDVLNDEQSFLSGNFYHSKQFQKMLPRFIKKKFIRYHLTHAFSNKQHCSNMHTLTTEFHSFFLIHGK